MATAPYQEGLTIVTEIVPGEEAELIETLRGIGSDVEGNDLVPFPQLASVHFARWVVLEASQDARGQPTPASLVFSTNFDEPVDAHLSELYDKAGQGLDRIYEHCQGYPAPAERTKETVLGYLRDHEVGYNTLYVGTRGRTVGQIRKEAALRDGIQAFLDEATRRPEFLQQDVQKIRRDIQEFVRSRPELTWAAEAPPQRRRFWTRPRDRTILLVLAVLILLLILLAFIIGPLPLLGILLIAGLAWVLVLRRKEKADEEFAATTDFAHLRTLVQREDRFVQNQMTAVNNLKPGWFRLVTLRAVLRVIDLAGRYVYTKGSLGSIPSIHFARWVIIDNGRRVIFLSNFDGSWENYLGDFIDKAATGLTAVWSNTHGFPRSRFLVLGGATDEQRFKAYARNSQVVTQVWYTAYKWLSVQNINNNSAIRAGLFGPQTPKETAAWLQRL